MARVTIEFPAENTFFDDQLALRMCDINYFGHLGHDSMVTLMHEARARFFEAHGHHESDTEGCSCIVADLQVLYKAEAHYPQVLRFELARGDVETYGCEIYYRITAVETGTVVALAKTGHVFFQGRDATLAKIPAAFRQLVGASQQ